MGGHEFGSFSSFRTSCRNRLSYKMRNLPGAGAHRFLREPYSYGVGQGTESVEIGSLGRTPFEGRQRMQVASTVPVF